MPKSKRNKIVHLTQVKKKGKDHKEDLKKQLEQLIEQHQLVYLFDFNETKADRIMNLRLRLKEHGRIFAGRNSLVTVTLRAIGSRNRTNYSSLVRQITGHRGLFFTNLECDKLVQLLEAGLPEFREKLVGFAHLKPTEADNTGSDSGGEAGQSSDDDDDEPAEGDGPTEARKRVTFRVIEKSKAKKKKKKNKTTTTAAATTTTTKAKKG